MKRKLSRFTSDLADRIFISRLHEIPFIVLISFLLTFVITRSYVYLTQHDILESIFSVNYISISNIHIHHFIWGILLISLSGFFSLFRLSPSAHRKLAVIYGIGLGLTFDEFALWLRLEDNYFAKASYDSIITISLILLSAIYFPGFWNRMGKHIRRYLP